MQGCVCMYLFGPTARTCLDTYGTGFESRIRYITGSQSNHFVGSSTGKAGEMRKPAATGSSSNGLLRQRDDEICDLSPRGITSSCGRSELENGGRDLNRMNHPPDKRFDSIRFERRFVGFDSYQSNVSENLRAVINDPQSRYSSS